MRGTLLGLGLAALALSGWQVERALASLEAEVDRHGGEIAGSGACVRCHPDHHASWARTHHRRMTQAATAQTVLGAFDGRTLDYGGYRARMDRTDDGRFLVEVTSERDVLARWIVERTVGSRRHQQLLAREDDLWVRLPIAWDVEEQRFFHMNGAFLTPDPEGLGGPTPIAPADYMRHAVRWNDNCVFCHNVGAEPRSDGHGHWDTRVAELGVACEACHGPGAEHVRANTSPFRRYVLHETGRADPTIATPSRLTRERATDVCARCHGQRITSDVSRYLAHGDPFVPGDVLADTSRPLAIDTSMGGDATVFAPRFWRDGTARLTAYEHQGVLQSRCGVTCGDCHAMHDYADVRGQLRADVSGDALCAGTCHAELADATAARAHARHDDVRCVDCHMPRIVYGIRTIHRSHRIEVPRPLDDERDGRPDACTLCHVEQSASWAARAIAGDESAPTTDERSRAETELFGGDPIERATLAAAFGRSGVVGDAAWRTGRLLAVMRDDRYPSVRGIAWRSLQPSLTDAPLDAFTATDDLATRTRAVAALAARAGAVPTVPDDATALRAAADARAIEIGE